MDFNHQLQKKQLWESENHRENYDTYRLPYPESYIQLILEKIPIEKRKNFLDLATGTGFLLFSLQESFSGVCIGIDSSIMQIETARKKLKEGEKKIRLEVMDIKEFGSYMFSNKLPRFDLITIGEALHWFDIEWSLKTIQEEWLSEEGVLSVLGYLCLGFEFNVKDESKAKKGYEIYGKMFSTVGPYYEIDINELVECYSMYPFAKYFQEIDKKVDIIKSEVSVSHLVKYFKTNSAYNNYLKKNKDEKGFFDVLITLEEEINQVLSGIKQEELLDKEKPLKVVKKHFILNLKKIV